MATFSVVRSGLVVVGAYIIGLGLVCRRSMPRRRRLPGSRFLLCISAGASAAVVATPAFADGPTPGPDVAPQLRYLGPAPGAVPPPMHVAGAAPDAGRPTTGPASPSDSPTHPDPSTARPAAGRHPVPWLPPLLHRTAGRPLTTRAVGWGTWVVQPGDDLWSIAQRHLERSSDGTPHPAVVAGYWRQVIAVNRARLPDPENPSLIFPGDSILLPPAPTPSGEPSNW